MCCAKMGTKRDINVICLTKHFSLIIHLIEWTTIFSPVKIYPFFIIVIVHMIKKQQSENYQIVNDF